MKVIEKRNRHVIASPLENTFICLYLCPFWKFWWTRKRMWQLECLFDWISSRYDNHFLNVKFQKFKADNGLFKFSKRLIPWQWQENRAQGWENQAAEGAMTWLRTKEVWAGESGPFQLDYSFIGVLLGVWFQSYYLFRKSPSGHFYHNAP